MFWDRDLVLKNIEEEVERKPLYLAMDKLIPGRRIMELRFGLFNGVEKTQKEVADLLTSQSTSPAWKKESSKDCRRRSGGWNNKVGGRTWGRMGSRKGVAVIR